MLLTPDIIKRLREAVRETTNKLTLLQTPNLREDVIKGQAYREVIIESEEG